MANSDIGKVKKIYLQSILKNRVADIKGYINRVSAKFKKPRWVNYKIALILFTFSIAMFGIFNSFNNVLESKAEYNANYSIASVLGENIKSSKTSTFQKPKFIDEDIRTYVFNEYFKSRNSPLYGQAHLFVEACDKFKAPKDCITTVAIARHETDLCKYYNSFQTNNCMGWGGGGEYRMTFPSMQAHIDTATRVLVQGYGADAMINPVLMEKVFCGPQDECIGWGNRVIIIMNEIDAFSESLGVGKLSALR